MKSRTKVYITLFSLMLFIGMVVTAYSAPLALKIGTMYPENSNYGKAVNKVAELARQYSKEDVKIDVYHGGTLGKKDQLVENIMRGTTDIYIENPNVFEAFIPEVSYESMPFIVKDVEQLRKLYKTDWFEKTIHSKFNAKGVLFIKQKFNWERGPYRVLVTNIPITSVDDLKKIKLRVPESETYRRAWQALGANTTTIDWTEVYLALKQNMVQGVTSPIDLVRPQKFTEVAKYITRINEFPNISIVYVNQKNFGKWTPAQREAIQRAADDAGDYLTKITYESIETDIPEMLEENGATLTRIPLKAWREKIKPFYETLEKEGKVPKGFLETVQSLK